MYDPIQDGIEKEARSLSYRQEEPPSELAEVVHSSMQ